MSLTSYRAAPPRDTLVEIVSQEQIPGLFRFGGDLLSHVLRRSTIGAVALNGRVRDGIGCFAHAVATKPEKTREHEVSFVVGCDFGSLAVDCLLDRDQAYRAISTGQLNALLRLHLRPIDVVVFHGPQGDLVLRGASRLDAFSGYPVRT
jgi:hypothetical protein